jgi:hypothetical protein
LILHVYVHHLSCYWFAAGIAIGISRSACIQRYAVLCILRVREGIVRCTRQYM